MSGAPVGLVPPGVVTVTSTAPAAPAGDVTVIWVLLATLRLVPRLEPKCTAVAPVKFVPVTVTLVPPAIGPPVGLIPVTVGPTLAVIRAATTTETPAGLWVVLGVTAPDTFGS